MADLTITNTDVLDPGGGSVKEANAAEVIDAGEIVYLDASGTLQLATITSATTAAAVGMALNDAVAVGQPVKYKTNGNVTISTQATEVGDPYVVSSNAPGKLSLYEDVNIITGDFITHIGIMTTTTNLAISIQASGVAKD